MLKIKNLRGAARRIGASALLAISAFATPAMAEDFPTRPIQMIVSYGAGGGTDTQARVIARFMEEKLGQPVVVQNMPGAGGTVALLALLHEPADGYTIVATNEPDMSMTVALRNAPYAREDLSVLAVDMIEPRILMVRNDAPYNSFADFVDDAKANPGALSLAITPGGAQEQFAKWLLRELDIDVKLVGYKSGGETTSAVIGGQVTGLVGDDFGRSNVNTEARALIIAAPEISPRWDGVQLMSEALEPYGVTAPTDTLLARMGVYVVPAELETKHPERFKALQDAIVSLGENEEFKALMSERGALDLVELKPGSVYRDTFKSELDLLKSMQE